MNQFYTYLHCKPDGSPFYVGKGFNSRAYTFYNRNEYHKRIVEKYGKENILIYVFPCNSEAQAFADEVQQIAQLRKDGYALCNLTDGGEGVAGLVFTDQHKEKIGKARLGKKRPPFSEEWKRKIGRPGRPSPKLGCKLTAEHIEKIRIASTGRLLTADVKRKISLSKIGKPRSEETKKKVSESLIKRHKMLKGL